MQNRNFKACATKGLHTVGRVKKLGPHFEMPLAAAYLIWTLLNSPVRCRIGHRVSILPMVIHSAAMPGPSWHLSRAADDFNVSRLTWRTYMRLHGSWELTHGNITAVPYAMYPQRQ
jgi:hypothetical protein